MNTLTDMPMISSVWMLENGKKLDTVGQIYLGNALVRNPGDCGGVKRMEGFEFKTENRIVVGMSGGVDSSVAPCC